MAEHAHIPTFRNPPAPHRFVSDHADADCRWCNGTGLMRDRGRLYGDPSTSSPCDCYDQQAAAREEAASFERHCADIRRCEYLMAQENSVLDAEADA